MLKKRRLITSALPYVNNVPHLGNIIGSLLSADVFARYCRLAGFETFFICGTDEFGTATEIKAFQENTTPQAICDHYHGLHKEIYEWFNLQFDAFGRTSAPLHSDLTQEIFKDLCQAGLIGTQVSDQYFDEKAQLFLADRFLIGTCPSCQNPKAHADQCDRCGMLLSAEELLTIRSAVSDSIPVKKKSTHLTIKLPAVSRELENWIHFQSHKWSQSAQSITHSWLKEGLKERTITRDLRWGVQVPHHAGLPDTTGKVFYVWFDAPVGYISIMASQKKDWQSWWQPETPESAPELFEFMGKDNVAFHSILFPSQLLGSNRGSNKRKWLLPTKICSTEYLNYESEKFSKSQSIGVFGPDAVASGIEADYWRYYLLSIRPENHDTNFLWSEFQAKINNELVANFGNLVHRTLSFINTHVNKVSPFKPDIALRETDETFLRASQEITDQIRECFEQVALKQALTLIMQYARMTNKYLQDTVPWKTIKNDLPQTQLTLFHLLKTLANLGILIHPFLPATAKKLFSQLGLQPRTIEQLHQEVPGGIALPDPKPLFSYLEDDTVAKLGSKFGSKKASN
jgi:methionyl-tRNA synthetase